MMLWCHFDHVVSKWFHVQALLDISFIVGMGSSVKKNQTNWSYILINSPFETASLLGFSQPLNFRELKLTK